MTNTAALKSNKTRYLARLLTVLDACLVAFAFLASIHIYVAINDLGSDVFARHMVFLLPLVVASAFSLFYFGTYRSLSTPSITTYLLSVVRGLLGGLVALFVTVFVFDIEYVSRLVIGIFFLLSILLIVGVRYFLVWWYFKRRVEDVSNYHKVLLIGTGSRALRLRELIANKSEWGITVVGHLDSDQDLIGSDIKGVKVIGSIDQIHQILCDNVIDEVMVAVPRNMLSSISSIADACDAEGVELRVMADLFDMGSARIKMELFAGVPLVTFAPVSYDDSQLLLKRIFDLVCVILASPFVITVMLLIALAIKLDDGGPVFFEQERVGLRKRRFKMHKFRSMVVDAEARMKEIEALNESEGPNFKMTNDPRITRVGRFIRKTSLDELPQLINVFLGSMSLVGPRPMSLRDVDLFDKAAQRKRFSVTPGLTCIWQISGRSNLSFEKWLELDLAYIDNWSLELDLKILVKTIPAVLLQRGAV